MKGTDVATSLNSVNLTGYLGGDPRLHVFDDGAEVCNLSLAVARSKKEDGAWVDDTLWVEVKVFGGQARSCDEYLAKGSYVAVSGQLAQPRTWTDANGEVRVSLVVDHASVSFGPRAEGVPAKGGDQPPVAPSGAQQGPNETEADDDDIPF